MGSSLEIQTWYEPYHAREFRFFKKTVFFRSLSMNVCNRFSVFWFLVLMKPVLETSKQFTEHLYPVISLRK